MNENVRFLPGLDESRLHVVLRKQYSLLDKLIFLLGQGLFHSKSSVMDDFYRERLFDHLAMQDTLEDLSERPITPTHEILEHSFLIDPKRQSSKGLLRKIFACADSLKERYKMNMHNGEWSEQVVHVFRRHFLQLNLLYSPELLVTLC